MYTTYSLAYALKYRPLGNPPRSCTVCLYSLHIYLFAYYPYFAHASPLLHFPLALSLYLPADDDATLCNPSQQCTQYGITSPAALMLLATTLRLRPPEHLYNISPALQSK